MTTENQIRRRMHMEPKKLHILSAAALIVSITALLVISYGLVTIQGELTSIKRDVYVLGAEVENLQVEAESLSTAVRGLTEGPQHMAGATEAGPKPTVEFTLKSFITGFKGVGGHIDGVTNPTQTVKVGDVVKVMLINGEDIEHDFEIEGLSVHSSHLQNEGDIATVTFTPHMEGNFTYFCSVPGHREAGMEGELIVEKVPEPTVEYTLRMHITGFVGVGGMIDGVKNPTLQAKVGDVVKVTLVNGQDVVHDFKIDEFSVDSGDLEHEGDTASVTFTPDREGHFSYYCSLPGHREAGMEGVLMVEGV